MCFTCHFYCVILIFCFHVYTAIWIASVSFNLALILVVILNIAALSHDDSMEVVTKSVASGKKWVVEEIN